MEIDINVVAAALKLYIRELPEPLLTFEAYDRLIVAASAPTEQDKVMEIASIVLSLPKANQALLKRLMQMMKKITANAENNKMTPSNLSIVFSMNLMFPKEQNPLRMLKETPAVKQVFEILLIHFDEILEPLDFDYSAKMAIVAEPTPTPSTTTTAAPAPTSEPISSQEKSVEEKPKISEPVATSEKKDDFVKMDYDSFSTTPTSPSALSSSHEDPKSPISAAATSSTTTEPQEKRKPSVAPPVPSKPLPKPVGAGPPKLLPQAPMRGPLPPTHAGTSGIASPRGTPPHSSNMTVPSSPRQAPPSQQAPPTQQQPPSQ